MGPLQMAASAGDQAVQVMCDFFVMVWEMTLAAVAVNVFAVTGLCCQRMTGHAGNLCVRCLLVLRRVEESDLLTGQSLRRRSELCMTVKTDVLDLLSGLAFLGQDQPVAGHARIVLGGKRREFFLFLVAGAALLMPRLAGIKLRLFLDRSLIVGIVAGQAHLVLLRILDLLGSVFPLLQIARNLFVANQAMVRIEESLDSLSYLFGVRMKRSRLDVVMTVPAGSLAMDRGVKLLGIDPPGGMGRGGEQPQKEDEQADSWEPLSCSVCSVGLFVQP